MNHVKNVINSLIKVLRFICKNHPCANRNKLNDLQLKIHPHAFEYVRGQMGIKDLYDLDRLLSFPKEDIEYNKFDKRH